MRFVTLLLIFISTGAFAEPLKTERTCTDLVCIEVRQFAHTVELWAETTRLMTVGVSVETEGLDGPTEPVSAIVNGRSPLYSWTIDGGPWSYRWFRTAHIGAVTAEHSDPAYLRPFVGDFEAKGHAGSDVNALDWAMPEGTPVLAARDGEVIASRGDSDSGCGTGRCAGAANYVYIRHDDGTVGQYLHLQHGGALVSAGDIVRAGDQIGLSGNTGFPTGPHLHFQVSTPTPGGQYGYKTFPVRFGLQSVAGGS